MYKRFREQLTYLLLLDLEGNKRNVYMTQKWFLSGDTRNVLYYRKWNQIKTAHAVWKVHAHTICTQIWCTCSNFSMGKKCNSQS
jgi:hypothetical protein